MRRLAIIDLPDGDQHIYNEDGSVGVVFNSEIYNFRERAGLERQGYRFATRSDTVRFTSQTGHRYDGTLDQQTRRSRAPHTSRRFIDQCELATPMGQPAPQQRADAPSVMSPRFTGHNQTVWHD
jgi:hypothetical protein